MATGEIEDHILQRYEVLKPMGKGAYGIVWKVRNKSTDKCFAMKKIFDAFYNEVDSQRTYREMMYLLELRGNENIIRLEDVIKSKNDRDLYLIFECMDADLHFVIKSKILSDIHKKYIIFQLFKALKFIHSASIVHRDLKPSNLLINSDCLIKVGDFGLARSVLSKDGSDPVVSDYVATRWYRAPEILLGSRSYSYSVDVWSAGCILAELYLGKVLFPGKSTMNQMEQLIQLLDTPTPQDVVGLGSEFAQEVINNLHCRKSRSFTMLFSNMCKQGIDLLRKMLVFDPRKRITVDEVLQHPYLSEFTQRENNFMTRSPIVLPIDDNIKMQVKEYRQAIYDRLNAPSQSIILKSSNIALNIPSQAKSSTSKERYSTKDITGEDKLVHNSSVHMHADNNLHCTSTITRVSKKSILSNGKSSKVLKKKKSLCDNSPVQKHAKHTSGCLSKGSGIISSMSRGQAGGKIHKNISSAISKLISSTSEKTIKVPPCKLPKDGSKNLAKSSSKGSIQNPLLRRHSQVSDIGRERKPRSISPLMSSKSILSSKSFTQMFTNSPVANTSLTGGKQIFKKSKKSLAPQNNLIEFIENTELFFKKFEPKKTKKQVGEGSRQIQR